MKNNSVKIDDFVIKIILLKNELFNDRVSSVLNYSWVFYHNVKKQTIFIDVTPKILVKFEMILVSKII